MTLAYYVNEIRGLMKERGDDSDLDDRLIMRWINSQRALWIKNQVNNEYSIEDNIIQTITGLELKTTTASECSYLISDKKFLVTKRDIPKPIEFKDRLGIIDVRIPEIGGYSINMVKKTSIRYVGNGRFNSRDVFGFYHNKKIYIKVPDNNFRVSLLTHITVEEVCENPLQVEAYKGIDNEKCYDIETSDYPINDALWEYMLAKIIEAKMSVFEAHLFKEENDDSSGQ